MKAAVPPIPLSWSSFSPPEPEKETEKETLPVSPRARSDPGVVGGMDKQVGFDEAVRGVMDLLAGEKDTSKMDPLFANAFREEDFARFKLVEPAKPDPQGPPDMPARMKLLKQALQSST